MPARPDLTIDNLEASQIDAASFDHEGHVYLAWLYLEAYPVTEAIDKFSAALKRLTLKLGVPGKYHATITWFFMLLIAERRRNPSKLTWAHFKAANDDLFQKDDNVLNRYYSKEMLASDEARQIFVLPDRVAA
jgi:N-formylglutamate deformylase